MKRPLIPTLLLLLLLACSPALAQYGPADTIRLGGVITPQGDTLPMVFLPEFERTGRMPRHIARLRRHNDKLRRNVYKVYPYAVAAAGILQDVDVNLARLEHDKKARRAYLKQVEKQLNQRFKGELESLTISQGQILVKLINRQTGKNCFSIIQELKGGFSAVVWQSVALLFSNNLKREYDPQDRDQDIEAIVRELEATLYYQYQAQNLGLNR